MTLLGKNTDQHATSSCLKHSAWGCCNKCNIVDFGNTCCTFFTVNIFFLYILLHSKFLMKTLMFACVAWLNSASKRLHWIRKCGNTWTLVINSSSSPLKTFTACDLLNVFEIVWI